MCRNALARLTVSVNFLENNPFYLHFMVTCGRFTKMNLGYLLANSSSHSLFSHTPAEVIHVIILFTLSISSLLTQLGRFCRKASRISFMELATSTSSSVKKLYILAVKLTPINKEIKAK